MAGKRYAVVVGVDNYSTAGISPLTCCSNDAIAIYNALTQYCGFHPENIILFTDKSELRPSYTGILSSVEKMCSKAENDDLIVFFFAGHGTADDNDSYLLTDEFKRNILQDSSIPLEKLNSYFSKSEAKFKLRIYDACQSGRFKERNDIARHAQEKDLLVNAEGWANLASCKSDEYAVELEELNQGLFSYFIVKGLSGEAAPNSETITLDNLKDYVMSKTIEAAQKIGAQQTPMFSGEQAGSLVLARRSRSDAEVPSKTNLDLQKIVAYDLESDLPNNSKLGELYNDLVYILNHPNNKTHMVISDSKTRNSIISSNIKESKDKFGDLVADLSAHLNGKVECAIQEVKMSEWPGQSFIANRIHRSLIRNVLDFYITMGTREVTKQDWARLPGINGFLAREDGFKRVEKTETIEYPERLSGSTLGIQITLQSKDRSIPSVALIYSPLPLKIGIYVVAYFIASEIDSIDSEELSNKTGILKYLKPLNPGSTTGELSDYGDLFAEFLSFFNEEIQKRAVLINSIFE